MKILLAVSGGIDSMYMAHRAPELFPGASFAVAHCNFTLRGDESDGDEQFVRDWCAKSGMPLFVRRFRTEEHAAARGISIEMAARELRYAWFAELCREHGFDALATAHNANDNAETLLLNMIRGCGSKGMRGMSPDSPLQGDSSLRLLRPLLGTERSEIREWMEAHSEGWREDRTNAESDCRRNVLRNEVFPILRGLNPSVIGTFGDDMARLRQTDDIAEDYLREALGKVALPDGSFSVTALLALKHWKYVLWRILEDTGINAQTFNRMTELLERYAGSPSGTVTLSGKSFETATCIVRFERKRMTLIPR